MKKIKDLEHLLGYTFSDNELLVRALTHSSILSKKKGVISNERLEFLGDAALELCVTTILFKRFPNSDEGKLTVMRSRLVSKKALIKIAMKLRVKDFIFVGEEIILSNTSSRFISSCVEAIVGAIFLDSDLPTLQKIIEKLWSPLIRNIRDRQNYKNLLQQELQKKGESLPVYKTIYKSGPDNAPIFEVALYINGIEVSRGKAKSKKTAEQIAALYYIKRYRL